MDEATHRGLAIEHRGAAGLVRVVEAIVHHFQQHRHPNAQHHRRQERQRVEERLRGGGWIGREDRRRALLWLPV